MPRKPYTVENQRPRRTVNLYGSVLAPKGKGRTSCVDLDLEEVLGAPSIRLLAVGRLKVLRGDMAPIAAKLAELDSDAGEAAPTPEPPAPVVEVAPPAPVEVPEVQEPAPVEEPPPAVEEESAEEELVAEEPAEEVVEDSSTWTYEELKDMNAAEQKAICRELGIRVGGREEERIQRILDHLQAQDGE